MVQSAFVLFALHLCLATTPFQDESKQSTLKRILQPTMALPSELKSEVTVLAFTQSFRNPLSFSPYAVRKFKQGSTRSKEQSVGKGSVSLGTTQARQKYSFVLTENDVEAFNADCKWTAEADALRRQGKTTTLSLGTESTLLRCDLTRLSDQAGWTLTLDTTVQPKLRDSVTSNGQLTDGQTAYQVATVYDVEGTGTKPSGFLISTEEGAVAATEVIPNGRLIFRNNTSAEMQSVLAVAAAALKLQRQLGD